MKIVIISNELLIEYKDLSPENYNARRDELVNQGIYIFGEPRQFDCPPVPYPEGGGIVEIRFTVRGGSQRIELLPDKACIILIHGSVINDELEADLPLSEYTTQRPRVTTFTIRHHKASKLYKLARKYLIESTTLNRDVLDEFKRVLLKATTIPWRYEYFLEVALRLQNTANKANESAIKRIILGEDLPDARWGMEYLMPYKQQCMEGCDSDEEKIFAEIKRRISAFLEASNKNTANWGEGELEAYMDIHSLLFNLCGEEWKEF
jgi:hypothetical protein